MFHSKISRFFCYIDKILILPLAFLSFLCFFNNSAHAAQVSLAWDPNTESNLAGYKIYYGTSSRSYGDPICVINQTTCTIENLTEGQTYYFAATAYDTLGNESAYSEELVYTVPVSVFSNTPPTASIDTVTTTSDAPVTIDVLSNDRDADGDALSIKSVSVASHGTTKISGNSVIYTPAANYSGTDSFTYIVMDTHEATATGSVSINVVAVNQPPTAIDKNFNTDQDKPFSGTLSASDPDGDALTYKIVTGGSKGTVTLTNAQTGTFTYSPFEGATGMDQFTFKANDGSLDSNEAKATISITASSGKITIETGDVSIDNNWTYVSFRKVFSDPVVVAKPAGYNDTDPCVERIRNVGPSGFEIRIAEWDYQDGSHAKETVSYLAMEKGSYVLPDGTLCEAGRFNTGNTTSFGRFGFRQTFQMEPVIITSITTENGKNTVTGRMQSIKTTGFGFKLQEQESNTKSHALETVSYIAWEPSAGSLGALHFAVSRTDKVMNSDWNSVVYGQSFEGPPALLADMQTTNGGDTAGLRYSSKNCIQSELKVEEEQSKDSETWHTTETVGIMAFEENPSKQREVVFAVNCGGSEYVDATGITYQADRLFSNGGTYVSTASIGGTPDDPLYQSERYGDFAYAIPVTNGNYLITLKFAEIYWDTADQRSFDVQIEGAEAVTNLDLFSKVGKFTPYDMVFPVSVRDGTLDIRFRTDKDNAKISAILVQTN